MNSEYEGYSIELGKFQLYCIKRIGKGALPESLKGAFTSPKEAMTAIDKLEKSDGKVNSGKGTK